MITAKGIRQASQSKNSQPTREDYDEPEREKRRVAPLAFLLFLTGCAAYLKSFLPIRIEAQEAQQASKHDDADQNDPRDDEIGAAAEEDVATDAAAANAKSSDNVVAIRLPQESGAPFASGSPAIGAAPPFVFPVATSPKGETAKGADNRPPAPSESGGSGGSGGGGGGGGGSGGDKPPTPSDPDPPVIPPTDTVRNRPPRTSGPVYLQDLAGCQVLMISVLTLLAGTTDPDGDRLNITNISSSSGTLAQTEDGGWMFARDVGMLGDVTLTYTISDGSASVQQTAYFRVIEAPPIIGTDGDDNLLGTHCADTIDGRAGDDNIDAREGNDIIIGGAGHDHIIAGSGNDIVYAGAGNDVVFAGLGNDIVFGGSGNDHLYGEDGDDTILGEDGDDFMSGGPGADILLAGPGDDTLQGDPDNDTLDGGDGNDCLSGGDGNDVLSDGTGCDKVDGGAGNDHVLAAVDADDDSYDGGTGRDILDFSAATRRVTFDLESGTAEGCETGHDTIAGFEEVVGGSGDDRIIAGSAAIVMSGGAGNDELKGGAANDTISDGTGCDKVDGGAGADHVLAATDADDDSYDGGTGRDILDFSAASQRATIDLENGTADGCETGHDTIAGFEEVVGGSGDDRIIAGSADIVMSGGAGNDELKGGAGNDTISDGAGCDVVSGGGGDDHVVAAADGSDDSYSGDAGHDRLDYSTATLSVRVDVGRGTADGLDIGHDLIAAFEEVIGGSGDDHIVAGSGSVSMAGGDGNDTFEFQRAEEDDQHAITVRRITDFTVGDRIVAATYEISYLQDEGAAADQLSDMFSDIYLSADGDNRPVRFRFEEHDNHKRTWIDVHDRADPDDFYTIEVLGHHQLQFTIAVT